MDGHPQSALDAAATLRKNRPFRARLALGKDDGRVLAMALLLVTCTAAGFYYVGVKGEDRSAFNRWQPLLGELLDGTDVYYRYAFPTPPIMGLILYPFSLLPGVAAMSAWYAFKTALTLWAAGRLLQTLAGPFSLAAGALLFLIVSRPILGDLLHGNVNLWILFLIVATALAYVNGRDVIGGLCLALAIACKLTPALLLPYFLWKRAWVLSASTLAGLVLWLVLVPGAVLGFSHNGMLLRHWADMMVWPYVTEGKVDAEQVNQSLPGLAYRLATESVAIETRDGVGDVSVNLVSLPPETLRWVLKACFIVLLVGFAWITRAPLERGDPRFWHELGLALLLMLLLSERSWKHHYVTILPGVIALVGFAASRNCRFIYGLLLFALLAMASTSNDLAKPFFGVHGAKLSQAYGAYVWAAFAIGLGHVYCHFRLRASVEA